MTVDLKLGIQAPEENPNGAPVLSSGIVPVQTGTHATPVDFTDQGIQAAVPSQIGLAVGVLNPPQGGAAPNVPAAPRFGVLLVSPCFGDPRGGQALILMCKGVEGAIGATIGGLPIGSFVLVSGSQITGTAPALQDGLYDVIVNLPGGVTTTLAGAYIACTSRFYGNTTRSAQGSLLFKDNAGTQPATANGDAVRNEADLSGNSNTALGQTSFSNPVLDTVDFNGMLRFANASDASAQALKTGDGSWTTFSLIGFFSGLTPANVNYPAVFVGGGSANKNNIQVRSSTQLGGLSGSYLSWFVATPNFAVSTYKVSANPILFDSAPHTLAITYDGTDAGAIAYVDATSVPVGADSPGNPGDPGSGPLTLMGFPPGETHTPSQEGLMGTVVWVARSITLAEVRCFDRWLRAIHNSPLLSP